MVEGLKRHTLWKDHSHFLHLSTAQAPQPNYICFLLPSIYFIARNYSCSKQYLWHNNQSSTQRLIQLCRLHGSGLIQPAQVLRVPLYYIGQSISIFMGSQIYCHPIRSACLPRMWFLRSLHNPINKSVCKFCLFIKFIGTRSMNLEILSGKRGEGGVLHLTAIAA